VVDSTVVLHNNYKVNKDKYKIHINQHLSRFTIGNCELPDGIILAPMAGVTDSPYRRITRRFGSGLLYSELISAEGMRRMGVKTFELARFHPDERPISIQLFGYNPQSFANAAAIIADKLEPDIIDINCGCPVKKMVRRDSGGYLMQFPELIGEIVEATRKASGLPVSVKLRSGYRVSEETASTAAIAAVDAGASLIAIHARYVTAPWSSNADWSVIKRVKEAVKQIPVIGNGDVQSWEDAERMKEQTGCDRVMIGRAARGKPWIFQSPNKNDEKQWEPSSHERINILIDHYRMMLEYIPEYRAVCRMRKHFGWYTKGLPGSSTLREKVMRMENPTEVIKILEWYRDERLKE